MQTQAITPTAEVVKLQQQRDKLLEDISNIAAIAHCGGVCGLSSDDALILIRKATLKRWDRNSNPQHVMDTIARVSNQIEGSWPYSTTGKIVDGYHD